jgi:hypothetical protein
MGESSSDSTQQSSTTPWANAMPTVNGLFGQLNNLIPNSGVTSAEQGAINQLTTNGQNGNQFAPAVAGVATNLLNGGGATSQVPAVQANLDAYKAGMSPYTDPNYSSLNNPAFKAALDQIATDTGNSVNSQFAAAGRDFSGMNQQTLARGIASGEAPVIASQFNTDTTNRMAALNGVYGAGNTTAGTIAGMNQQGVANQQAGIQASNDALTAENWGPQQTIAAQELAKSIPASNLGLLAQIGIPLAQLGTNTNTTSHTTNDPSPIQDITGLAGALGSGKTATSGGSGLLGLLGMI